MTPGSTGVTQLAHIHTGTCDPLGSIEFPLNSVLNGRSETVIDVSLSTLVASPHSVNVHMAEPNSAASAACGSLPGG